MGTFSPSTVAGGRRKRRKEEGVQFRMKSNSRGTVASRSHKLFDNEFILYSCNIQ